jgi:ferredoxin
MALWFLRGLRRGVVTTRYPVPSAADEWAASLPTPPVVDPSRLSNEVAARLIEICSSGAFWREGTDLVLDLGACTACGRCFEVAGGTVRPSGAIELAATRREDLLKRMPVRPT